MTSSVVDRVLISDVARATVNDEPHRLMVADRVDNELTATFVDHPHPIVAVVGEAGVDLVGRQTIGIEVLMVWVRIGRIGGPEAKSKAEVRTRGRGRRIFRASF